MAPQAQEKLKNDQANYSAIANRIVTKEKAAKDLETANQLAKRAASLIQNPSYSQETKQTAQAKLQETIRLLQAIPQETLVKEQVQEKLLIY